jgi:hypothetical protein
VATPWLASPHIQTCFLNFHGLPPVFTYTRWFGIFQYFCLILSHKFVCFIVLF